MKIGIDIRVLMDKHYSGVSQYAANLLTAILRLDKENDYYLFYNSWQNLDNRFAAFTGDQVHLVGRHIPNKIFNYFCQKLLARPKIDRLLGGVDVFFSPHFNFTSLSARPKKIITVHDLSFLRHPEFFNVRKNFWHRALGVKKILRQADNIVAVSENTKNDIVELVGISPEKISVIYSGLNLNNSLSSEEFAASSEASKFLETHGLSGRLILYLGTIEPRKNIKNLIVAYNQLREKDERYRDVKLVLAGAKGWKSRGIYRAAKKSPYQQDILFLGYISEKEREILYSKSLVFVYPSFYEGFGFPPLEALAKGLPVICSNVSSLPEVVSGAAILINPQEVEAIREALETVITDEELRKMLITKGLARAQEFSWDKAAQNYLNIFFKSNHENSKK